MVTGWENFTDDDAELFESLTAGCSGDDVYLVFIEIEGLITPSVTPPPTLKSIFNQKGHHASRLPIEICR